MKKTRMIAIALAVAVALMGAGYAVWTQNYTVTGTVNTGQLKLDISETCGSPAIHFQYWDGEIDKLDWDPVDAADIEKYNLNDKAKAEITDGSVITFSYGNMFPGLEAYQEFKITNNGTVPVMIKAAKFYDITGDSSMFDNMRAKLFFLDDGKFTGRRFKLSKLVNQGDLLDASYGAIATDLNALEIETGDSIIVRVGAFLDIHAPNDDTELKNGEYKFQLEFVQSNLKGYDD